MNSSRYLRLNVLAITILFVGCAAGMTTSGLPTRVSPGLAHGLAVADSTITAALGTLAPGAVLVVSKDGRIVHERAFGVAQRAVTCSRDAVASFSCINAEARPMRTSTVFDLASVTKVMATTFGMMMLVDQGKIDLDAPVYTYLPDFRGPHLDSIRVRNLLQHSAGLVQWQPLYYQASNTAQTHAAIRDMPLQWGVGEARHYSDFSFMLLGDIVEHVTGQRLDVYLGSSLYKPLGLTHTTFNPKKKGLIEFAATEQGNVYEKHMVYDSTFGYRYRGDPTSWNGWRNYTLVGEVDDGNSYYANGGVAGHAGLFSTGAELRVLLDLLLNHGSYNGRTYIRPEVIDRFFTLDQYQNYLGWQYPSGTPPGSFSHTGFTGTYVFGDPRDGISIVLLTNRQNLGTDEKGYFPNVGPLQMAVTKAIVEGAESDAAKH